MPDVTLPGARANPAGVPFFAAQLIQYLEDRSCPLSSFLSLSHSFFSLGRFGNDAAILPGGYDGFL